MIPQRFAIRTVSPIPHQIGRIVAKHVGWMDGRKVNFHNANYAVSNFRPSNIFELDFPVKR